ncbi:MAG: hypothetical protein V2A76_09395 [Planctomycetota bacterium]
MRRSPVLPTAWLLFAGLVSPAQATEDPEEVQVIPLTEISVFETGRSSDLTRGQYSSCGLEPDAEVHAYPSRKSAEPFYGSIDFGPAAGGVRKYVIDESGGTGTGHDRLIIDLDQDLDLTNDAPLGPHPEPPVRADTYRDLMEQVCFQSFRVTCDYGPAGERPVEVLPRLSVRASNDQPYRSMTFTATRAREGSLTLGDRCLKLYLGNARYAARPFDGPGTTLLISDEGGRGGSPHWWGGDQLRAMHRLDGQLYGFSATPLGDELTVRRYRGDLGTFELAAGDRKLEQFSMEGSLENERVAVAVGQTAEGSWNEPAASCRLPVGNYRPSYLDLEYGHLKISISFNYHADGKPRGYTDRSPVYAIEVRKDQPFILDFSTPPEVMFAAPAKEQRYRRGEAVEVLAVLTDPKLDIMFRRIYDTSQTTRKESTSAAGRTSISGRRVSLDPKVIITRASGEKIVEGTLPFG